MAENYSEMKIVEMPSEPVDAVVGAADVVVVVGIVVEDDFEVGFAVAAAAVVGTEFDDLSVILVTAISCEPDLENRAVVKR